jgi:hypothetical protein
MFLEGTTFDEAARYLLTKATEWLLVWLLRLEPGHVRFEGWMDSVLTLPGTKERICDAIARLSELRRGGFPIAALVEVETRPDPNMLGRLMIAGGICHVTEKPTPLPGDRYGLAAIVINLTGKGNSGGETILGTARWIIQPQEWDLESLDAAVMLEDIAAGQTPREMLPFVPLMKNSGDPGIIQRWLEIAGQETDPEIRGDLTLAVVFANAVGCQEQWRKALEGFAVMESSVVNEWKAEARREGERKAMVEAVIQVLETRRGSVPEEVKAAIRKSKDAAELERWLRLAVLAESLEQFRTEAGLSSRN